MLMRILFTVDLNYKSLSIWSFEYLKQSFRYVPIFLLYNGEMDAHIFAVTFHAW